MKAILLAGGKGTRISRMIEQVPKSTLPINGVPLIRYSVEMLQENGFECCVCTGYKKEKIYKALEGLDVTYYNNPFFDVTNSIASLWFARDFLKDIEDCIIIMNADVYISKEILTLVVDSEYDNVLAIDKSTTQIGDYFFKTSDSGNLKKYGKELPLRDRSGEYVGIAKINRSFSGYFIDRLDHMIDIQDHQKWWENVLYSMIGERQINTIDVSGNFWSEIDFFDDYERILNFVDSKAR